ncbi:MULTISPECIES: sensor domain-containing diguanylate cyclase [Clostridium]|uniref:sensor domain-containing diguanylate cyclase n=1 Tax=Clostridium TaxID=1485 RepID=UPI000824B311|nr:MULTISPECIES: diguanylate cyclase [Clostridium]PJI07541.1 diguanylate cyclase [Clostridium sp. CT7]
MKKRLLLVSLIFLVCCVLFISYSNKNDNVAAYKGSINLKKYDFNKNGVVNLQGQWELYYNSILTPEQLKNKRSNKYLTVPGNLKKWLNGKSNKYMTLHFKIYAQDNVVYGIRIDQMFSASKVWVNGVLQGQVGKVGENFSSEKAIYLPEYYYFTAQNGIIDVVIQTSAYREIFPTIKAIKFGLKDEIMNEYILNSSIDLIVFGGLLIVELMFLLISKKVKSDKSSLYFSILCIFIQFRCLFLNERIVIHLFPNMPFEVLSKTAALTYYLWIPIYALFLREIFHDFPKKIVYVSTIFSAVFAFICIITNNTFYDRLSILGQIISGIIICAILVFLIMCVIKKVKESVISILALSILILGCINDMLVNNGIIYGKYIFQIYMFAFALIETYLLTFKYSNQIIKTEKLKIENKIMYEKSIKDPLTGLYNRNYIEEMLDEVIRNYIDNGIIFTVLMFDIDYFKIINDTYGHLVGDKVLVCISDIIRNDLGIEDCAGRYGGEEFIVILPNTKEEKAIVIAEKIREDVENLFLEENIKVTISGGVYENKGYEKRECVGKADKMLYSAKEKGRNRIEIY